MLIRRELALARVIVTLVVTGLGVVGYPTTTPTAPSGPTMPVTAPTTPAVPASSVTPLLQGEPQAALFSPADYLTDDVEIVVARRKLAVHRSPEFSPDTDTGAWVPRKGLARVSEVVLAASGEPRLHVGNGYISAAVADVRRPVLVEPKAHASLAIDMDTGAVLWESAADASVRIASVTKLLAVFVVRDWMAAGGGTWETGVKVTDKNLVKMSKDWDTGGFKFKRGGVYTVRDLYTLSLVESSNAAITALGVKVAGANLDFLDLMNAKAQEIGMSSSHFISVSGLDNKSLGKFGLIVPGTGAGDGNVSTARDVGRLTTALVAAYPDVFETTSITQTKVKGKKVKSTNQLLPGEKYHNSNVPVDGLKTGYTSAAGYCLVATAAPAGRHRVMVVILGAKSSKARFSGTEKLLRSIYSRWSLRPPATPAP